MVTLLRDFSSFEPSARWHNSFRQSLLAQLAVGDSHMSSREEVRDAGQKSGRPDRERGPRAPCYVASANGPIGCKRSNHAQQCIGDGPIALIPEDQSYDHTHENPSRYQQRKPKHLILRLLR
jgi:hypothetical protein